MQPTWGDFTLGSQDGTSNRTRFPLFAIAYPVVSLGGTVTLSLGGQMEQRWVTETEAVTDLGGVIVPSVDRFESEGGTSVARIGWAHRLGSSFAVGASAGAYLGRLDQNFTRTLDSLAIGGNIQPFVEAGSWRYSGKTLTLGASADPTELIHVAAALEWSTDLEAEPLEETLGETRVFEVPMRLSAGATLTLTPRMNANTSIRIQDWSGAAGLEPDGTSSGSMSYGVGMEWRAIQGETRSMPVRVGYRSVALPFRLDGGDLSESSITFGVGLNLVEAQGSRFGWVDMALERGSRQSMPLDERFWRATLSIGVSGF